MPTGTTAVEASGNRGIIFYGGKKAERSGSSASSLVEALERGRQDPAACLSSAPIKNDLLKMNEDEQGQEFFLHSGLTEEDLQSFVSCSIRNQLNGAKTSPFVSVQSQNSAIADNEEHSVALESQVAVRQPVAPESQAAEGHPSVLASPVVEAKPSWFTRLVVKPLVEKICKGTPFDAMRRINALKNFGCASVATGAVVLAILFPPAAVVVSVSSLVVVAAAWLVVELFTPEIVEIGAKATAAALENTSAATKAKACAFKAASTALVSGGDKADAAMVAAAAGGVAHVCHRMGKSAKTTVATATAMGMAVGGVTDASVVFHDPLGVKAALLAGIAVAPLVFPEVQAEDCKKLVDIALEGAQVGDELGPWLVALLSGSPMGATLVALNYYLIKKMSEDYLPEGMAQTQIAQCIRTVLLNTASAYFVGSYAGLPAALMTSCSVGNMMLHGLKEYLQKKPEGWLEEQIQDFMKKRQGNVTQTTDAMKLVATKAPENALKVMKLAGNTVVTTLFNDDNIGSALSNFFQGGLGTVGTEDPFETHEDVDNMEEAPNVGLLGKIKDIWMRQEAVAPVLIEEID